MTKSLASDPLSGLEIAIIGMAGRFPGAKNIDQFWQNLCDGVESIKFSSDDEVLSAGADPALLTGPNYVKAGAPLDGLDLFDAPFFGINPREAETMDPQHRLFLECAWEGLENAGYESEKYSGLIGVYAGSAVSSYVCNVETLHGLMESTGAFPILLGNDKDYVATRVSYKLNLQGPSITVQTACSTSLVAVHLACQGLLSGECDIALAGGVAAHRSPGYVFQEGMIMSPDGHTRVFDAKARGTIFGSGVAVVVLKRLADALADGDNIVAVIKGSAINNDGSAKAAYTAPSVDGQIGVIKTAQAMAEIDPETVTYVEAHGTATELGDPIEIAALTRAFRFRTQKTGFCGIGSVKSNVGHLDAAAGVAGLIKTVLALKHKMLPPTLHFETPNPKIDFANSPFFVNTKLSEWKNGTAPRRAGVNAFGVGGTNAHVILEEAPVAELAGPSRPWQELWLSARTPTALEAATRNLAEYLKCHHDLNLADVSYTLKVGRKDFYHRRSVTCKDLDDAVGALESLDSKRVFTSASEPKDRPVVFMFTGQGSQYVNMALDLYRHEPVFCERVDSCAEILRSHLGLDLLKVLYPSAEDAEEATAQLNQTALTQPALFVIEYALANLLIHWGIKPQAMIGHSVGEYVAACLAEVFSVEDVLKLIAARGRLMNQLPAGSMLAVPLPETEVRALLGTDLSLAAINGPSLCVVSGPTEAIDLIEKKLAEREVDGRRLHTSHAFHSAMMEPILKPFTEEVNRVKLHPPKLPCISNVTGTWLTTEQATSPDYWAVHLRQAVRFSQGISELLKEPDRVLLEVGPGQTLTFLAQQHIGKPARAEGGAVVHATIRRPQETQSDEAYLMNTLGKLWLLGIRPDWNAFYANERRQRVPLPSYPFERQRYWLEPPKRKHGTGKGDHAASVYKRPNMSDWFYVPSWKRSVPVGALNQQDSPDQRLSWVVFLDECGLGVGLAHGLTQLGHEVIGVRVGDRFGKISDTHYCINPRSRGDYTALIKELCARGKFADKIVHLWNVTARKEFFSDVESFETLQFFGLYSLSFLAQALGEQHVTDAVQIAVISNDLHEVNDEKVMLSERATVLSACKVIPQEYPNITCRNIDVTFSQSNNGKESNLLGGLIAELNSGLTDSIVAHRGKHRWVQTFEPLRQRAVSNGLPRLRERGVYLITGGLGGIGLVFAEYLARTVRAKLILTGRTGLPPKEQWKGWLGAHNEQDPISQRIRKVQELEGLGGEVLTYSADVADTEQMRDVLTQTTERFGSLHGVIHAAGLVHEGSALPVQDADVEGFSRHFRPKVHGLYVLEKILQGRQLDFCLLTSSISSVLGGLGYVGYAAANIFMDAFVAERRQIEGLPWISINYDAWILGEDGNDDFGIGSELQKLSITPAEGEETLRRVLSADGVPQIIVSTGDLESRIDQWIKLEALRDKNHSENSESATSLSFHPRPNLATSYAAPVSELQQAMVGIWQDLLGIDQVGINDNFFELGGHSLLATQVVSRMRDALKVKISPRNLFEAPTIAALTEWLDASSKGVGGQKAKPDHMTKEVEIEL